MNDKAASRRPGDYRRHRAHAQITADRLKSDVFRWADKLDGTELDEFSHVIQALEEIADEQR